MRARSSSPATGHERQGLPLAAELQPGLGEGAVLARVDLKLEGLQGAGAGQGHQDAPARHLGLQGREPGGIGAAVLQQAQALAHGLLVGGGGLGVGRFGGEGQAVEAAAVAGRFQEQTVLLRRQRTGRTRVGHPAGRGRLAVDAHDAAARGGSVHARAEAAQGRRAARPRPTPPRVFPEPRQAPGGPRPGPRSRADRVPAQGRRSPPGGWSCPPRWAHAGRPSGQATSAPRADSCGNPSRSGKGLSNHSPNTAHPRESGDPGFFSWVGARHRGRARPG